MMYNLPTILKAYSSSSRPPGVVPAQVVVRPSTVTGGSYGEVSKAYSEAVYSVLSKRNKADDAAPLLEQQLLRVEAVAAGGKPPASATKP